MKLIIKNGDTRVVRYGVRDFQVDDSGIVHVFYPPEARREFDIEDSEELSGRVVAGEDAISFRDVEYKTEDLDHEEQAADDLEDYRVD